jgi:uncharacterized membrane protein YeaQ/YmgE (transglycosylase-associated protein family)
MGILLLIVVGAAAGFIATRMMKLDWGVPQTIAVGVLGSFVGLMIMRLLSAAFGMLSGFVGAILGAMLLIWIWQKVVPKK